MDIGDGIVLLFPSSFPFLLRVGEGWKGKEGKEKDRYRRVFMRVVHVVRSRAREGEEESRAKRGEMCPEAKFHLTQLRQARRLGRPLTSTVALRVDLART